MICFDLFCAVWLFVWLLFACFVLGCVCLYSGLFFVVFG